jgi:type I restriction enzyme S subunit
VPEHWKVSRIKRISQKISKGSTPTTIGVEFADEGVRFIKGENITDKGISRYPEFFISENTHQLMSRSELHARDVLVVIAGTIGKAAVLDESMVPANTSQAIAYIRLRDPNIADYVNLWFGSDLVKTHLVLGTVKTAQPNLSMEDLGNVPFILPSTNEIESILSTLTAKLYELDALNKNIERSIDLLQERRSALISAAVTGQIDVRDH